ncbi:MAG: DUF2892 domain-containing protein [Myxococcota bacterium]
MELKKLVTYSFAPNVGTADRIGRVVVGGVVASAGLWATLPFWAVIATAVSGGAWALTGIVSRCGMYYLLGHSTCPVSGESFER